MSISLNEIIKRTIQRDEETISLDKMKNKIPYYKMNRYNNYLNSVRMYIEDSIRDASKIPGKQKTVHHILKTLTDEDKLLLSTNAFYLSDFNTVKKSSSHSRDERSVEDHIMSLQIGSVMEKMAIIDAKRKGYEMFENPKATHQITNRPNYNPDFIIKYRDKTIEIELQTSNREYDSIQCKRGKLNALKGFSDEGRDVYILQQSLTKNGYSYSFVNVADEFYLDKEDCKQHDSSNKVWMKSVNKSEHKRIDDTLRCIFKDVDNRNKSMSFDEVVNYFKEKSKTNKKFQIENTVAMNISR